MRDYRFGNFLHELRVRRGLSQFQLGMLVGVSNKAVSAWHTGMAHRVFWEDWVSVSESSWHTACETCHDLDVV